MSLFGPYLFENKKKKKFWLHMSQRGKRTLYYFSKDPKGAISMPKGFEAFENEKSGLPMLRRKTSSLGFLSKGKKPLGKGKEKEDDK